MATITGSQRLLNISGNNIATAVSLEAGGTLLDGGGLSGASNQVLISTGSGVDWVDGSGSGIIGGPYLPLSGGGMTGTLVIGSQQLKFSDAGRLFMGDSNDLQIYHDGSNSYINDVGTGDLYLQTNGTNMFLRDSASGNTFIAMNTGTADVSLRQNGNIKLITTSTGVTVTGAATATTFLGDLNGTINTVTTAVTKANATSDTTVATTAFVQNLIGTIPAGLVFQGTWNAATNTPTLTSGSGTTGHFYIVSTSGSTNLDGVTDWVTGDWAVFIEQGATDAWEKIDNSSVLDGTGTGNQITKWAGSGTSNTLTDSSITDNGTSVGIGTTLPGAAYKLEVNGLLKANGGYFTNPVSIFDSSFTENPRLSLGRSSGETLNFDVDDRIAIIYHKQDETSGIHKLSLSVDSDSVDTNTIDFNFRNSAGTTTTSTPMTILSSGRVGIGTSSPSTRLHVVGSAGEFALSLQNSSNGDGIKITTENQTANNGFLWNQGSSNLVNMYSSSTTNASKMIMLGGGVDKIFFNTEGNSYFNGGNVGIGTTSPGYKLSVSGNIGLTDGVSTGLLALVGGNYYIQNTGAYSTVFQTNGAERMRITSTGNVGIGTTSPSRPLSVYRSTAGSAANFLHYTDATAFAGLYIDVDNVNNIVELNASGDTASTMAFQTGNAERMRITTTGSVGIGTTSPDSFNSEARNLVVNGSGDVGISIATTTTTGNSSVVFADGTGGTAGYRGRLKYGHATDYMAFFTAAAERLRITSAGNVGIGTTSPDRPLSVVGGNSMVARFQSTNTTAFIQLSNTVSTADQVRIGSNGTNLVLSTNYAERMRITSAGAIKFNAYDSTNNTGTPTYLLGTDASGNVVKTLSTPSPITSQAASLYDLIPNGAFTTTYAFTSTAGTYAEVMSGDDVITAAGTYSVQMYVNDYAVGGTQYREYYSGVMSWNAPDSTNDTGIGAVSEIVLHRAGHAANSGITYLRTRETGSGENNELRLEIMCNKTYTGASNVVFKFVRLI